MRAKRTAQISQFDPQALDRHVVDELERASAWLDVHPELLDEIAADLDGGAESSNGRHGLTGETVPGAEKVVSLFERRTKIVVKSGHVTRYGYKIRLVAGWFFNVVEIGNPADSVLSADA